MEAHRFVHRYATMNNGGRPFNIVLKCLFGGTGFDLGMEWTGLTALRNTPFHVRFAGMKFGRGMCSGRMVFVRCAISRRLGG